MAEADARRDEEDEGLDHREDSQQSSNVFLSWPFTCALLLMSIGSSTTFFLLRLFEICFKPLINALKAWRSSHPSRTWAPWVPDFSQRFADLKLFFGVSLSAVEPRNWADWLKSSLLFATPACTPESITRRTRVGLGCCY